jgi:membrane protein DedA with SNARE-associated domain
VVDQGWIDMESIQHSLQNFIVELQTGQLAGLGYWKYLLLAVLTFFEGPVATLVAAAAASTGLLNPVLVFFSAAAGNLAGDTCWYLLGRLGRKFKIERLTNRVGVNSKQLDRLSRQMQRGAPTVLFFAKLSNSFIVPGLIAAGLSKMSWRRWFLPVLGAEMLWTGTLVVTGYASIEVLDRIKTGLPWIGFLASAVFGLILFGVLRRSASKRRAAELMFAEPDPEKESPCAS